jgi:hypothetical protein
VTAGSAQIILPLSAFRLRRTANPGNAWSEASAADVSLFDWAEGKLDPLAIAGWAATLRLSPAQRKLLLAVNDWLRSTNGGNVPIAAAAERAYELIRNEKAFDSIPPRGGAQLWGLCGRCPCLSVASAAKHPEYTDI